MKNLSDNELLELREALDTKGGRLILRYAALFLIATSAKNNSNAEWVKGMGMLLDHLNEVEELCQQKFNSK